jgi:hypothetical protein
LTILFNKPSMLVASKGCFKEHNSYRITPAGGSTQRKREHRTGQDTEQSAHRQTGKQEGPQNKSLTSRRGDQSQLQVAIKTDRATTCLIWHCRACSCRFRAKGSKAEKERAKTRNTSERQWTRMSEIRCCGRSHCPWKHIVRCSRIHGVSS